MVPEIGEGLECRLSWWFSLVSVVPLISTSCSFFPFAIKPSNDAPWKSFSLSEVTPTQDLPLAPCIFKPFPIDVPVARAQNNSPNSSHHFPTLGGTFSFWSLHLLHLLHLLHPLFLSPLWHAFSSWLCWFGLFPDLCMILILISCYSWLPTYAIAGLWVYLLFCWSFSFLFFSFWDVWIDLDLSTYYYPTGT